MIDSHCHLADEAFTSDLDAVIARARDAGIGDALCILAAGDEPETARARIVRDRWGAVRFAAGVHPHAAAPFAARAPDAAALTRAHLAAFAGCALGEIGLDYHYDFAPRDVQQDVFAAQLDLARQLDLPVIIHTRE
ncbi:MAG TPA: TatD family hydrolase, partial [Vicinamibacterales bacterium]